MNTRRWTLIVSFAAGTVAASCLPAAAQPPSTDVIAQPCAGLINALSGCYRPDSYYYGGPLSGANYERYYGNYWPHDGNYGPPSYRRHARHPRVAK